MSELKKCVQCGGAIVPGRELSHTIFYRPKIERFYLRGRVKRVRPIAKKQVTVCSAKCGSYHQIAQEG